MHPASDIAIAAHNLRSRALLAPMAGITDPAFRRRAEAFGAGWTVSEMIASAALGVGNREMVRRIGPTGDLPHVVQLAGCEARWMARGAEIAADAGADIIDINFGCPSKRVTNGFAGSALMRVPDEALKLFESVANATSLPVTVKMRLGWDDDGLNAPDLARRCVDAGARMIVVHARTRQQFYKGAARWHLVRPVVDAVNVPVVVNGDIVDLPTVRQALEDSGADAVMIGRGAQGRPWFVGQVGDALAGRPQTPAPTGQALADFVVGHYADMLSDYGTTLGVRVARKHLNWYAEAHPAPGAEALDRALLRETDSDIVIDLIGRRFAATEELAA